jgi:hypothetical protein
MSKLIYVSFETSQGNNSWHYTAGNQHHNQYGHEVVSRAILENIYAQDGWIEYFKE